MRLVPVLAVAIVVVACRARTPKCGAGRGFPPPETEPGSLLFERSDAACPRARPITGDPCSLPLEPEDNARGERTSLVSCHYVAPTRGVCEADGCTCVLAKAGDKPAWSCDLLIID